jgi:hypothetical protein
VLEIEDYTLVEQLLDTEDGEDLFSLQRVIGV